MTGAAVSTKQLKRALEASARIVAASGGEWALPIFERLEAEYGARERAEDARARASKIAGRSGNGL